MITGVITLAPNGRYICRLRTPRLYASVSGYTLLDALNKAWKSMGLPVETE